MGKILKRRGVIKTIFHKMIILKFERGRKL